MYIRLFFHLILLFLGITPSNANIISRGSRSIKSASHRAHDAAIRHSAGLARDLRYALRGVLAAQSPSTSSDSVYCVSSNLGSIGNGKGGTGNGNITSGASVVHHSSTNRPSSTTSAGTSSPTSTPVPSSPWKLLDSYQGQNFFNGWNFFTGADPTNGNVVFLDQTTANSSGLVDINNKGNAVMRVETTPQVQTNRKSVRITTQTTFNGGLVIMDSVHMPTGCGTWPAFWTNGPNWPAGGEIDIVEGVNTYTNNQATIHTNVGCSIPSSISTTLGITGSVVGGTNCAASQSNNEGCGVRSDSDVSFGSGFNSNGGGVYAMLWDNSGISVYFFPRGSVPADITEGAPQPSNWSTPMANWPSTNCNTSQFFYDHSAIFDTTLCGDWASGVWGSTGVPGQSASCQQQTGFATCQQFVQSSGASFNEAYWEVSSVKIYQTSS